MPTWSFRLRRLLLVLLGSCIGLVAPRAADFEFVVIGDTRPKLESENFKVFEDLISRINAVRPALVVNLGDLIYGYGLRRKETQWDRYQQVIRAFEVPYHQVPGNHDTFSRDARRIYGRRFGKFYESFDQGGCHFVLVNNCEEGRWGYIGPAEMEWLRTDLHAHPAGPTFVFMHFPLWESERVRPRYHEFWRQTLHPLFRDSGVKGVFGGHFHCYGPTREIDGIRYFITGGGGAELRPDYRKAGGVHHFMRVRVTGDDFNVRVVTSQGELSDVDADIMGGFQFADRHSSRIGIARELQDLRRGVSFSVATQNPYPQWLTGRAIWQLDRTTFSGEPPSAEIRVAPGGATNTTFTLKALKDTATLQGLPWLEFDLKSGGNHHRFSREILFLRRLPTPYLRGSLSLNGSLADWNAAPKLDLDGRPQTQAEVRAFHDRQKLYLAVTVPVRPPAGEEEREEAFTDDLQLGIAGRLSSTEFGGDLIRLGMAGVGRSTRISDRTPRHKPGGTLAGVEGGSRTENGRTVFEVAIPMKRIAPLNPEGRKRLVLSLSFPVAESAESAADLGNPSLNSFSYQVRYGSDALVPVHFVELLLEPRN